MFCFFSSRRRHTRCALVTGVQTCALPISAVATGLLPSQEHVMRWGCASSRFQAQSIEFRHALERRVACMLADRQRLIAAVEPPALPFLEPGVHARVDGHGDAARFAGRTADIAADSKPTSRADRQAHPLPTYW